MKKIILLTSVAALTLSASAQAGGPKFLGWVWWPSHWYNQDFQPYYETSTEPHNTQWDDNKLSEEQWTPKEWVSLDGGSGFELIRKFYVADILRDQYVSRGKPYIVVGPNFYHLGGAEKERVMRTVDAVYKVTDYSPKAFYLEDFRTDQVIGIYSKNGLDLQ